MFLIGGGSTPKLSFIFLGGGWDGVAVHVLVEGCGTGVRGVEDSLAGGESVWELRTELEFPS